MRNSPFPLKTDKTFQSQSCCSTRRVHYYYNMFAININCITWTVIENPHRAFVSSGGEGPEGGGVGTFQ